ncbi:unnamed protein product [Pieris macdunnoughi]|uniref:Sperm microtubule inner protein 1 C-terminal domain-containing protein n=1 Tax=Pieris macdunnoughi TaxID=345717 RepID=A0A821QJD8_9NEOP|nr:unnamed protein product [Pieris macdunnoughi]
MPIDYTNPNVLKFVIENFTKENERRILWFNKNKEKILKAAEHNKPTKYCVEDVSRANIEPCIQSLSLHHESSNVNRRRKPIRDGKINLSAKYSPRIKAKLSKEVEMMDVKQIPNSIMMPVEENVSKVLHESQPDGGRLQYLRKRARKIPEERYYFCETSNNTCGWKLNESKMEYCHSNRRVYTYKRDVLARSGPQPDPDYYGQPLMTKNFKCSI